ncbi:UNVERIFIED_CONTAM: hypothetical protein Slati_3003400 [Sesamum latifolium]|uniref:Uncharacterized protein n=1 Tax=Sesamum latifolium TaxID=2727402 RepID=A0AAW2VG90_9LAMI
MYNKNLLGRAGLTPEFEDGVKTFIEWAKGQCDIWMETKLGALVESAKSQSLEPPTKLVITCEPTPAAHVEANNHPHWGDEQHMDWVQRMVFDAAGSSYFSSSHIVCQMMVRVRAVDQPLWNGCTQPCTQSQLGVVAESVDIKADGHISERIYDQISQLGNKILPPGDTLPGDYYNTKKLIKDLSLPVEKTGVCKNGCMLYWKDDIDLEYCKFYGNARYKSIRGQDPRRKKSQYDVLRYLPFTPYLQRLYSSTATGKHMTWHATHQTEEGSTCHPSDAEAWKHFDQMYPDFAEESRNVRFGLRPDGFMSHGQYGRTYSCWSVTIFPLTVSPLATSLRRNKKAFTKNRIENKVARPRLSGDQHLDWVADISPTVEMSLSLPEGYGSDHKWRKKSIFWDLPYCSTLMIRHKP